MSLKSFRQDNTFTWTAKLSELRLGEGIVPGAKLTMIDLWGDYAAKDFTQEAAISVNGNVEGWRYIEDVFCPVPRANRMKVLILNQ